MRLVFQDRLKLADEQGEGVGTQGEVVPGEA